MLLQFGVAMLRAGNTASRTRDWMQILAGKMGLGALSVGVTSDSITATVCDSGRPVTALSEIGTVGINVWRIAELERLALTVEPRRELSEISARMAEIQSAQALFSQAQLVAAIGFASAGFAFLNGAATREVIFAGIAGGIGQGSRSWLIGRRLNPYGIAAAAAMAASASYVLLAVLAAYVGFGIVHYPAGFIASVLFLVPGFPLISALFDLMQHQTTAAIGRLTHGVMILLALALGLSIVIAVGRVDLERQPLIELGYALQIVLRALASLAAGCAFAMLFNCPARAILAVGLLALVVNVLRLVLIDMGMKLAPAAFLAAMSVGAAALIVDRRFKLPRMAMIVPAIVIMVPGLYAFETIVLLNRGYVLEALQAASSCSFVVAALAMGLAAVRFVQTQN